MRLLTTLAAAAALTLGFAAQASAYTLSPTSTGFTATGDVAVIKGMTYLFCTMDIAGTTDAAGVGTVTSAALGGTPLCALFIPNGLPWTMTATGAGTAAISNVSFTSSFWGACGPTALTVSISGAGAITFNSYLAPNCGFKTNSSGLATSPAVTVIP